MLHDWSSTWPESLKGRSPISVRASLHYGDCDFEDDIRLVGIGPTDVFRIRFSTTTEIDEPPAPFEIILRESLQEQAVPKMRLKTNADMYGRADVRVNATLSATTTRHDSCFTIIQAWLHGCESMHELCHRHKDRKHPLQLPARLISITEEHTRLITADSSFSSQPDTRYITLSHRWGSQDMPRLLKQNLERFRKVIDFTKMPQTFADTVDVARRLDVQFIWIDALCIVQDDPEDCAKEIGAMGDIYRNAYCNLGAHVAADYLGTGLYTSRDPRSIQVQQIFLERSDFRGAFYAYPHVEPTTMASSALMQRGWVFQERLLSPRSVYFGKKLQWECSELQACEMFPDGPPMSPHVCPWGIDGHPFRLANLLVDGLKHHGSLRESHLEAAAYDLVTPTQTQLSMRRQQELNRKWLFLVQWFSTCQLSYEQDTLPALEGLARCFQQSLCDRYVAGLWEKHLVQGLFWIRPPGVIPKFPANFRGKSHLSPR